MPPPRPSTRLLAGCRRAPATRPRAPGRDARDARRAVRARRRAPAAKPAPASLACGRRRTLRVPLGTADRREPQQAAALAELRSWPRRIQRAARARRGSTSPPPAANEARACEQLAAEQARARCCASERAVLIDKSFQAGETPLPERLRRPEQRCSGRGCRRHPSGGAACRCHRAPLCRRQERLRSFSAAHCSPAALLPAVRGSRRRPMATRRIRPPPPRLLSPASRPLPRPSSWSGASATARSLIWSSASRPMRRCGRATLQVEAGFA